MLGDQSSFHMLRGSTKVVLYFGEGVFCGSCVLANFVVTEMIRVCYMRVGGISNE